jgi:PAS domain S-box-containing protein
MLSGWWATPRGRAVKERMSATERALAESNERYRSLFAYSPHAAFSLDLEGNFTDANEVAQRLSGHNLQELREIAFTDIICTADIERSIKAFGGAVDRVPQQVEVDMWHKNGSVIELSVAVVPVVVRDEVVGVHGVAEDVTERNEMRRELERTRRSAEEASAAKSLFLANMSHEVRTPLTSVLGATELLAEDGLDARQQRLVGMIHRSGERLLRLVNDILDVSRLEAGTVAVEREPFDVRRVVDDVVAWALPQAEREGLDFNWTVGASVPEQLCGDSMRISQVLTNLLGNALKFTEVGKVSLDVELATSGPDPQEVRFVIEDSGIGIPADQLTLLFESFTQVDTSTTRKYGGAGLGLAICQELITLMGGSLDVRSAPGTGSRFAFTVPIGPVAPRSR